MNLQHVTIEISDEGLLVRNGSPLDVLAFSIACPSGGGVEHLFENEEALNPGAVYLAAPTAIPAAVLDAVLFSDGSVEGDDLCNSSACWRSRIEATRILYESLAACDQYEFEQRAAGWVRQAEEVHARCFPSMPYLTLPPEPAFPAFELAFPIVLAGMATFLLEDTRALPDQRQRAQRALKRLHLPNVHKK